MAGPHWSREVGRQAVIILSCLLLGGCLTTLDVTIHEVKHLGMIGDESREFTGELEFSFQVPDSKGSTDLFRLRRSASLRMDLCFVCTKDESFPWEETLSIDLPSGTKVADVDFTCILKGSGDSSHYRASDHLFSDEVRGRLEDGPMKESAVLTVRWNRDGETFGRYYRVVYSARIRKRIKLEGGGGPDYAMFDRMMSPCR